MELIFKKKWKNIIFDYSLKTMCKFGVTDELSNSNFDVYAGSNNE